MLSRILLPIIILYIEVVSCRRAVREKPVEARTFASCFEDIGCFDVTEKWYHTKYRPKNLEPLDRHTIRTEFLLMKTPKNYSHDLLYDVMAAKHDSIQVAGFKKGTCSIFIIHDFTSNGYTGWIKHLVIAFGKKTDCNIISIDWQAGAEPPFDQAIANARVVALEAKAFINLLKSCFKQSPDNLHLVGHGVGAHIAGYIGKYIPGVQRITGLDPTGPSFAKMPSEVRLDSDDAKYVEILHTDSFNHRSQGMKATYGHVDFIINNADHQPGCNDSSHMPSFIDLHRDSLQEGKILPACSHKRSFKYYIQSLEDDECQFIGIKCASYKNFINGQCNNCTGGNCASFGLEPPCATSKNNTYYLLTNSKKPFCMVTYGVNITVTTGTVAKELEGYFEFILVDENDKVTNASTNTNDKIIRKFDSGHVYGFIFYSLAPAVNKIKEAKVKWVYKSSKICIMCDKSIPVKEITIIRLAVKHDPSLVTNVICPATHGEDLKSGDYVQFQTCESLYGPDYLKNGHKAEQMLHPHGGPTTNAYCAGIDRLLANKNSTGNGMISSTPGLSPTSNEGSSAVTVQISPAISEASLTASPLTVGPGELRKLRAYFDAKGKSRFPFFGTTRRSFSTRIQGVKNVKTQA